MVTNEEFKAALQDENNIKIINSVLSKFSNVIPQDDLESCKFDALWRCLGYHRDGMGNKFTTSLHKFTKWECLRTLRRIRRQSANTVNVSAIEFFDAPAPVQDSNAVYLRECIALLDPRDAELINQYYFEQHTMEEIGRLHGYSKEAARQKINRAVGKLRSRCIKTIAR